MLPAYTLAPARGVVRLLDWLPQAQDPPTFSCLVMHVVVVVVVVGGVVVGREERRGGGEGCCWWWSHH